MLILQFGEDVDRPHPPRIFFNTMNEIVKVSPYSERTARVTIYNPEIASKSQPGNFVIVKFKEDGVRIPFSVISSDTEKGVIDIIIHRAAGLEEILRIIHPGEPLPHLLGPLGHPAVIEKNKNILFFGDGSGVVSLLPLIQASRAAGCRIVAVLSEESSRTKCLLPEIDQECKEVITVTDANLVEVVEQQLGAHKIDRVVMAGPSLMMKRVAKECKRLEIPADCVLNMLMIDGIGLCGICRVIVNGERKQTCTDGPIFNAHEVDFDQLYNRQNLFV